MDMNQLLRAHQLAAMSEARAASRAARSVHADDVAGLAVRIRAMREDSGVDITGAPFVLGEPVADYFDR